MFLDSDLYLQSFNLLDNVEDLVVNLLDVSLDGFLVVSQDNNLSFD